MSSMVICLTVACSLTGQTSTLSFGQRAPVSMRPVTQKPEPVPLNMSLTDNRNALSKERSGVLKLSGRGMQFVKRAIENFSMKNG